MTLSVAPPPRAEAPAIVVQDQAEQVTVSTATVSETGLEFAVCLTNASLARWVGFRHSAVGDRTRWDPPSEIAWPAFARSLFPSERAMTPDESAGVDAVIMGHAIGAARKRGEPRR
jgi:hypothetical protein